MSRKFTTQDKVNYTDDFTVIHDTNLNNLQEGVLYNTEELEGLEIPSDLNDLTDSQGLLTSKEDKTYLTIGSTQYELVISSTDAGQSGKIVFYVE